SDPTHCGNCTTVCGGTESCAESSCKTPLTIQSSFNPVAVASCPAFPLNAGSCLNWASGGAPQHFTGSLVSPAAAVLVLNPQLQLGDRMDFHSVMSTASSSAGVRQYIRNDAGVARSNDSSAFGPTQQPTYDST